MTQEAGQDQPELDPDHEKSLKNQHLREACAAHRVIQEDKSADTITVEMEGRCIGRDKRPVPRADVFKLSAIGCKETEIAEWFGVDKNTLRYHFQTELIKGREHLKQSLRRKQLDVAMSGNAVMLIFLGKNILGQSDSPVAAQDVTILPWSDE